MPSAFPNRYVDKGDPQYERWFRHVFVLRPPLQGATARDFVQFAQDLKSAIETKSLSDTDSIPRSSLGGQGLTLQTLKDEVTDIIARNPVEWIRGCVGISIMHHPERREKLFSVLSKPESAHSEQKLLSVRHADDVFVFNVQFHENNFIPTDGLYIWLDNPSDPAAEHAVPSDTGESLTIRDVYESKQKMEHFAIMSLCNDLLSNTTLTHSDLKCWYEPLGDDTFPDFELLVRGREWAVEVTRIESGMVGYLRVSQPLERETFDRAARNQVTDSGIVAALTKASEDKTKRRNDCSRYSRACLLLVDIVDSIDPESSAIWGGIDLSAFDVVALVKLDGRVFFIKGDHALESVS